MAPRPQVEVLARYQTEIKRSRRWRQQESYDALWRRMIDLYAGKHYESMSEQDRMVVNLAFATKNVIAPSVAVNNPRFTVHARKPEEAAQAVIAEEVVNYLWRSNRYHEEFRLAVDDWLTVGHGWIKVGYKYVKEEAMYETDAGEEGVDDREPVPGNVESERVVKDDRPFAERISPFDMYVDPDAKSIRDLRWIAQRIRRPVADVRVDSRYSPKVRKAVQPATRSRWTFDDERESTNYTDSSRSDEGYVDVIEFYDVRRCLYSVFVDGQGEGFLIKPQPMPYAFGHPFVMMRNYEVVDRFYPMGELEAVEALQLELNTTRTEMMLHRRRFARKYLYLESAFDDAGIAGLESDEDNTMVPVLGESLDVVAPMPAVITPPDFYNQSQMISEDINSVSGVSDYMRGSAPNIRRTATEAAMLQDSQNSRAADKLAKVEGILADIGMRLIQVMQQYMTGDQVVRVVGMTAFPVWVNYGPEWIQGEFDFEVEAGSTQPRNETFRRQSAMQLMDAMAPFVQMGVVNPIELARHILTNGFGIKDPQRFLAGDEAAPPMMGDPAGMPGGMPPPQGQMMPPEALAGGMPQESSIPAGVLQQLATTVGLDVPNLA
jgi:hypothetical protein